MTSARRVAELLGEWGDPGPRYLSLAERVRLLVSDGRLPVGVRLPAERELALALALSRATVTAAYAHLRAQGWADARRGSGTWTALPGISRPSAWVAGLVPEGLVDLAHAGAAAPPQVATAFAAALADLPALLPGHGYHPAGLPDLRARIAERYTTLGLPTVAEQVLVTSGALHGVSLALDVLTRRGERLLLEQPSYPNAMDAAVARGLRLVGVAVEPEAEAFVAAVVRTAAQVRASAAYLMPDWQNPTGMLLDARQRGRIAAGLRRAGTVPVIDESVYELGLDTVAPVPFAATDPGLCVSVGSLSKPVWGGLRVGWLRADAELITRLTTTGAMRSDMAGPVLEQLAACHLLDDLEPVLTHRRESLRRSREVLLTGLAAHLPDWRMTVPSGGQVLWCHLPQARSSALVVAAERHGLRLAAGPRFGTGHAFEDRLRLPYTPSEQVLHEAVPHLAQAYDDLPPAGRVRSAAARRHGPVV